MRLAWRGLLIAGCLGGMWWAHRLLRADAEYRKETAEGVRAAIGWDAENPGYWIRLSELEPDRAEELLEKALELNPNSARAAIDLAMRAEARGDFRRAERLLDRAFRANRRWLTRWALANFYFRRDEMDRFWEWVRRSSEMPAEDLYPLFELCRRAGGDAERILREAVTRDPKVLRQFVEYAERQGDSGDGQWAGAAETAGLRLADSGGKMDDLGRLLGLTDRLMTRWPEKAAAVWSALERKGWVEKDGGQPYNGKFGRTPLGAGFDWRLPPAEGVQAVTGPAGLEVEFSGQQPGEWTIAEQPLAPGWSAGVVRYRYRTSGIAAGSGLRWEVREESGAMAGASADLSAAAETEESFRFDAKGAGMIRLRLAYKRAPGTKRISGTIAISSVRLDK